MFTKNSLISLAVATSFLCGCSGGSSSVSKNKSSAVAPSELMSSPSNMSFGSVAVGSSKSQNGTLGAAGSAVTISSAAWTGGGFSLSGITFPITIAAGSTALFTVTFTPQAGGSASGQVTFYSNVSDLAAGLSLSGTGIAPTQQHSVSLSWNASASQVGGYNVYRSTQSFGTFSKLNSSLDTATVYTDSTVVSGHTYYYAATSVDTNNFESGYSNVAIAVIP
jgi:hypothetical protein